MATANQPPVNGSGTTRTGLVPTNSVTWDKHTVRARIDPTLSVADVIKQLCLNLKIQHSSTNYALRDELDQLVTNENLKKMIKAKSNLKCVQIALCFVSYTPIVDPWLAVCGDETDTLHSRLVKAPHIEANDIVDKLHKRDDKTIRMTLFSLQKYIRVMSLFPESHRSYSKQSRRKSPSPMNFSIKMACITSFKSFISPMATPSP